ncbi:putative dyslexia susceptibility 1 candidate 1 protein [Paratrimastix pyriformis]|uniref:Dyslexia susceptibility 1 candidate 1 protein n=1 Tax=Paratrimastix pyriformis TaxID=342808 RepID=A0ABQ8ULQ2_9EUKA|nr:putative dyslexia susceptibility 1 candidate 1 protein [Paratrimastix pyriformis]
MPLNLEFTWEDSTGTAIVRVKIPVGVSPNDLDVQCGDLFLKVSFPPTYILQLDLLHEIDTDLSKVTVLRDERIVEIHLQKREMAEWPEGLTIPKEFPISDRIMRREDSLGRLRAHLDEVAKKRAEANSIRQRGLVSHQMDEDRRDREALQKVEDEIRSALAPAPKPQPVRQEREAPPPKPRKGYITELPEETSQPPRGTSTARPSNTIFDTVPEAPAPSGAPMPPPPPPHALPEVRASCVIRANFTPKTSKMGLPERTTDDRPVRLVKPLDALNPVPGARSIQEQSPLFLVAKGDSFFKMGDFLSAVEAYSAGITADPTHLGCLTHRSLAFLRLGNYHATVSDCDRILAMPEAVPADAPIVHGEDRPAQPGVPTLIRTRVRARKATALFALGRTVEEQWIVHLIPNQKVRGSSPRRTVHFSYFGFHCVLCWVSACGFDFTARKEIEAALKVCPNNSELKTECQQLLQQLCATAEEREEVKLAQEVD